MARFLWKLVPLVPVFSLALAQSVTALKTYYATDLERSPGLIQLSPGFTTVVDCWDVVDSVASAKPELLRMEIEGPRILLSAQEKAGKTDLILEVGGRTLLFTVDIAPGSMPRRYKIELFRQSSQSAVLRNWSSSLSEEGASVEPFIPSEPRGEAGVRLPKPPAPLPKEETPPSNPDSQGKTPSRREGPEEVDIRFTTTAQVPSDVSGTISVFYTLENRSRRSVAVDPSRLVVVQGEEHLSYTLRREPLRSILAPGEAQSGLLVIKGARPGELRLVWTLVEIGTGREIHLSRSVTPGTRIELQTP